MLCNRYQVSGACIAPALTQITEYISRFNLSFYLYQTHSASTFSSSIPTSWSMLSMFNQSIVQCLILVTFNWIRVRLNYIKISIRCSDFRLRHFDKILHHIYRHHFLSSDRCFHTDHRDLYHFTLSIVIRTRLWIFESIHQHRVFFLLFAWAYRLFSSITEVYPLLFYLF